LEKIGTNRKNVEKFGKAVCELEKKELEQTAVSPIL